MVSSPHPCEGTDACIECECEGVEPLVISRGALRIACTLWRLRELGESGKCAFDRMIDSLEAHSRLMHRFECERLHDDRLGAHGGVRARSRPV